MTVTPITTTSLYFTIELLKQTISNTDTMRSPFYSGYSILGSFLSNLGFTRILDTAHQLNRCKPIWNSLADTNPIIQPIVELLALEDKYIQKLKEDATDKTRMIDHVINCILCEFISELGYKKIADTYYREIKKLGY